MMLIVTYDVDYSEESGAKRLRKVAKICEKYGVRVQNSVFEMMIDNVMLIELKRKLDEVINHEKDSIRIYNLGNKWSRKIYVIGKEINFKQDETLLF